MHCGLSYFCASSESLVSVRYVFLRFVSGSLRGGKYTGLAEPELESVDCKKIIQEKKLYKKIKLYKKRKLYIIHNTHTCHMSVFECESKTVV